MSHMNGISASGNSMPMNCGMKGMHENGDSINRESSIKKQENKQLIEKKQGSIEAKMGKGGNLDIQI